MQCRRELDGSAQLRLGSVILDELERDQGANQGQAGRYKHEHAKAEDKRFVDRLCHRGARVALDTQR